MVAVLEAFVDMTMKMFCIYSEIVMLPEAFRTNLFHRFHLIKHEVIFIIGHYLTVG
ncbi:hypothetical protein Gogos_005958 [Gossypium gossypioides]|uniref:Uncharacterized protein n=1 Tax=Gossypium gossypioides TaxID=34282 RepID=A0A7J9C4G9_GOSGO|nr:hypothetical protein [Gossypium gossypioides]